MYWITLFASIFFPLMFAVGFFIGKWHAKRLAVNGGEERYPEVVAQYVREYRDEKQYYIESLRERNNDD